MNWKSGAMWVGLATGLGMTIGFVLPSTQADQVAHYGDIAKQVAEIAGAAILALVVAIRKSKGSTSSNG